MEKKFFLANIEIMFPSNSNNKKRRLFLLMYYSHASGAVKALKAYFVH